jgi:hypothetical protein
MKKRFMAAVVVPVVVVVAVACISHIPNKPVKHTVR